MVNNSTNIKLSTKLAIISHLKLLNIKKTITNDVGLGQAHACKGIKPVNGTPILTFLII